MQKRRTFQSVKSRQFLKLFGEDANASQITSISGVSRNAANLWMNRIRRRIYQLYEQEKLQNATCAQMDGTFFNGSGSTAKQDWLPAREIVAFGRRDDIYKLLLRRFRDVNL